jgi:hypothetical protein
VLGPAKEGAGIETMKDLADRVTAIMRRFLSLKK